jgi:hypothetical protein
MASCLGDSIRYGDRFFYMPDIVILPFAGPQHFAMGSRGSYWCHRSGSPGRCSFCCDLWLSFVVHTTTRDQTYSISWSPICSHVPDRYQSMDRLQFHVRSPSFSQHDHSEIHALRLSMVPLEIPGLSMKCIPLLSGWLPSPDLPRSLFQTI